MSLTSDSASKKHNILGNNQRQQLWFSRIILALIVLFAIFLRYENFMSWEKNKEIFQYQGEYSMANFDSYYYLQIAKELAEGTYDGIQENRRVPNGVENSTIPPLLSSITATISRLTHIHVSTVAIFMPVFLASLLAPLIFVLGQKLHFNKIASLTAALFSIISITYIIRTRIGVFDTDCLNVVFILLNSYLFYCFAEFKNNKRYWYLILGIFTTFLSFIWWNTATSVVMLSAVIPLSVTFIFFYTTKNKIIKYSILGLIFTVSIYFINGELMSYFNLLFNKTNSIFPNNMSISELNSVGLKYFIEKTSKNYIVFLGMVIGIIALGWKLRLKALFFMIPFILGVVPFFAGNRFMIFSAPILALGIGYTVQMIFDYEKKINRTLAYFITLLIVIVGIASNYKMITKKYEKPATFENITLLNVLGKNTPNHANIWTDWNLGYQIQYYLNRGTYADGEFTDGEIYYYNSFPLASNNLAVSANFMRFYTKNGIKGMNILYQSFLGVENTFKFLTKILSLSPTKAKQWIVEKQQKGEFPKSPNLTTPEQWISFIFPRKLDDIYLLLHYKMTQTASWFKQGNSNLKTGKTIGLPLFLPLIYLKEQNNKIRNNQIILDTNTGVANYFNEKRFFQSLSTFNGVETSTKSFSLQAELKFQSIQKDSRFVFHWNKQIGFGAAMSKEMANTTFVKLYLLQEKSEHFKPISINTPEYQIWKITGNSYEIE